MSEFNNFIHLNRERIDAIASKLSDYIIYAPNSIGESESRSRIKRWLENFYLLGVSNLEIPLRLLEKTEFILKQDVIYALDEKIRSVIVEDGKSLLNHVNTYIAPLGETNESSFHFAASYYKSSNFRTTITDALKSIDESSKGYIILLDDFLNSGGQIINIFYSLLGLSLPEKIPNDEFDSRTRLPENLRTKLLNVEVHVFFYLGFEQGWSNLYHKIVNEAGINIKVHFVKTATSASGLFGDSAHQEKIKEKAPTRSIVNTLNCTETDFFDLYDILSKVGMSLLRSNKPHWSKDRYEKNTLGYGNAGMTLIIEDNIPTNTLTCLWQSGIIRVNNRVVFWQELLPRKEKVLSERREAVFPMNISSKLIEYHNQVLGCYLKSNIGKIVIEQGLGEQVEHLCDQYSVLFENIITPYIETKSLPLISWMAERITKSKGLYPLSIKGYAGIGKTTLLSLLYLKLYQNFTNCIGAPYPIYISLHYYNKRKYISEDFNKEAYFLMQNELDAIRKQANKHTDLALVFIIDGIDEYINTKIDIYQILKNEFDKFENQEKKYVGGFRIHDILFRNVGYFTALWPDPKWTIEINLRRIKTASDRAEKFVKDFCLVWISKKQFEFKKDAIIDTKELFNEIDSCIKKVNVEELDLYLLHILSDSVITHEQKHTSLSRIYNDFTRNSIHGAVNASELAFKMFHHPDSVDKKEKNRSIWWTIQKHSSIRDFLVANYIVQALVHFDKARPQKILNVFSFVYSSSVNRFCKELLNEDRVQEQKAFATISFLIKSKYKLSLNTLAHFCYILGRMVYATLAKDAQILLKNNKLLEKAVSHKKNNTDEYLLFERTRYISLANLGDKSASEDYIKKMMDDKSYDDVNRGFHLEYYGDRDEDPEYTPDRPGFLMHRDNLKAFPKTYNRLIRKIRSALFNESFRGYPLFEIELYTLCSLVFHRLDKGGVILPEEWIESIIKVIDLAISPRFSLERNNSVLDPYLVFIRKCVSEKIAIVPMHAIEKIYGLKSLPRSGWVKRKLSIEHGVMHPETIGSHIFGACVTALFLLPDKNMLDIDEPEREDYNKDKIINMLLIHDLGEAEIGDKLPGEKGEAEKERERSYIGFLSQIGDWENLSKLNHILNDYDSVENQQGINGRIAKDIDRIDNLIQLYIYFIEYSHILTREKFEFWEDDLERKIKTKIGQNLMKMVKRHFDVRIRKIINGL